MTQTGTGSGGSAPEKPRVRLGIGSAFDALEALGATQITIRYLQDGSEVPVLIGALIGGEAVVRSAQTLREALDLVVEAVSKTRITLRHAANRVRVVLPDGSLGTLIFLDRHHLMASVRTAEGKTRSIPAALLTLTEGTKGE